MTYYETIKGMTKREMVAVFYMWIVPWTKAYSKEEKQEVWKRIEDFLNSEVKDGERIFRETESNPR
jgi:hypothetical protein